MKCGVTGNLQVLGKVNNLGRNPNWPGSGAVGSKGEIPFLSGKVTFKADAGDRSGIEKVEFYLNHARLIGTATQAPYTCDYTVKEKYIQQIYAIAYDKAGNQRKSFVVPFGENGLIGPPMHDQEKTDGKSFVVPLGDE